MWYHKMGRLVNREYTFHSHLGPHYHNLIQAKRIATVRTLVVSNFTVNALHQVNIAKIAIAMAAVIIMRTKLLEKKLYLLFLKEILMLSGPRLLPTSLKLLRYLNLTDK